jgi:hypothetical protein
LLLLVIPLAIIATIKAATLYVLDYELRWYVITDRSLLIREGAWNVSESVVAVRAASATGDRRRIIFAPSRLRTALRARSCRRIRASLAACGRRC